MIRSKILQLKLKIKLKSILIAKKKNNRDIKLKNK